MRAAISDNEARAALWREQQRRRLAFQAALRASLAGDPEAWRRFHAAWEPVIAWRLEAQEPPIDPPAEIDPLGISEQVNVGR